MSAVTAARSARVRDVERLRYPRVEFVRGQPLIQNAVLSSLDYLLSIAAGDTKAAIPSA